MIKFRCTNCSKAIGVDDKHAGKQVKCPQCQTQLLIPTPDLPIEAIPMEPPPQSQPQAGGAFDPFGELPTSTSGADDPFGSLPAASPLAAPRKVKPKQTPQAAPAAMAAQTNTSFGKNFAGLAAAAVVAMVCSIVWLLVLVFTGREFGILAWGIGGLIGLIAGVIAKNPSPVYCGLAAAIAAMGVLGAKLIIAIFLMFAANFGDFAGSFNPSSIKEYAAIKSEMLDKNEFEGDEAKFVELEVDLFFVDSESSLGDEGTDDDDYFSIAMAVQKKVSERHKEMDESQLSSLMERAKKKYPMWIEHEHEYQAAVDSLIANSEIKDEKVLAYAENEMKEMDGNYDTGYSNSVSNDDRNKCRLGLRELASAKLNELDPVQCDELIREAIKNHPVWSPFHDDYLAVLEKMHSEKKLDGPLAEHATSVVDNFLRDKDADDYYDSISDDEYEKRDAELTTEVNQELVNFDAAERKQMVRNLMTKYPDWFPTSTEFGEDEDLAAAERELEELGINGSFWSSFMAVFGIFDVLWLVFGVSTAYSVAYKHGVGETE